MSKRIRDVAPEGALVNEDDEPVMDVVLPDTDEKLRAQGWRLHIYREFADGNVYIASERVLPEKVGDARANRVFDSRRVLLHPDEVAWLHARLGELLGTESELARWRPVIEAAKRWHAEMDWNATRSHGEVFTCESLLDAAIDHALGGKGDG